MEPVGGGQTQRGVRHQAVVGLAKGCLQLGVRGAGFGDRALQPPPRLAESPHGQEQLAAVPAETSRRLAFRQAGVEHLHGLGDLAQPAVQPRRPDRRFRIAWIRPQSRARLDEFACGPPQIPAAEVTGPPGAGAEARPGVQVLDVRGSGLLVPGRLFERQNHPTPLPTRSPAAAHRASTMAAVHFKRQAAASLLPRIAAQAYHGDDRRSVGEVSEADPAPADVRRLPSGRPRPGRGSS